MIVSMAVAIAMLLWVSSAWLGIVPIVIYQFVSGAAGQSGAPGTYWSRSPA